VDESLQFVHIVRGTGIEGFAGLPLFLVGVSLGGFICTTMALQDQGSFAGGLAALAVPLLRHWPAQS
jgi:alpha-beta hydrolase superfamily lysophospholipase